MRRCRRRECIVNPPMMQQTLCSLHEHNDRCAAADYLIYYMRFGFATFLTTKRLFWRSHSSHRCKAEDRHVRTFFCLASVIAVNTLWQPPGQSWPMGRSLRLFLLWRAQQVSGNCDNTWAGCRLLQGQWVRCRNTS